MKLRKLYSLRLIVLALGLIFTIQFQAQTITGNNTTTVAIPDSDAIGASSTVNISGVPADAILAEIEIDLAINHTWLGDLRIQLTSPDGDAIFMLGRPGLGGSPSGSCCGDATNISSGAPITFSDSSVNDAEDMGATLAGGDTVCLNDSICDYFPNDDSGSPQRFADLATTINSFCGAINGDWIVTILDGAGGDTGDFSVPELRISYTPGTPPVTNPVLTGTAGDDDFEIAFLNGSLTVIQNGVLVLGQCAPDTNSLTINAGDGDDMLTINFDGGDYDFPITFNGEGQTAIPGDIMMFTGTESYNTVTHTFATDNDGTIAISNNSIITYTGLEPIVDNLDAANRIFTFSGGAETITLDAGGTLANQIDSTLGESVDFNNPTTSLTINAGTGDDSINIEGLAAGFDADLVVDGQVDNDNINFQINPTNLGSGNLLTSSEQLFVSANIATTGSITTLSADNTLVNNNAIVQTSDGDINMTGGVFATAGLNFKGIEVNGAIIETTGAGAISLIGQGGNNGTSNFTDGIEVTGGATIRALATGSVSLNGTGGAGNAGTRGILMNGASTVTTVDGTISFTGQGGASTGTFNIGVDVRASSIVQATGTGTITMNGTGGTGSSSNWGLGVSSDNTLISVNDGDIQLTGIASSITSGNQNIGALLFNGADIVNTGSGTITMNGMGGAGASSNWGLGFSSDNTLVSANGGTILLTGMASNITTGNQNFGISLLTGPDIVNTGTGAITMNGTGGSGTNQNHGVVYGNAPTATTVTDAGAITITGQSLASTTGTDNTAVQILAAALIESTSGSITITGNGGAGTNGNNGIEVSGTGTINTTGGGVTLNGTAGAPTGNNNQGVVINGASVVEDLGAGDVTIIGQGSNVGNQSNRGVEIQGNNVRVAANGGAISINGTGGITGTNTFMIGTSIRNNAAITNTGVGTISISGTAGQGTGSNYGIELISTGTVISTEDGTIVIDGVSNANAGSNNFGTYIQAQVTASGSGSIQIDGTGGNGTNSNHGIRLNTANINSAGGGISMTGVANGTNNSNVGVLIQNTAVVQDATTGAISINGTGAAGNNANRGILVTSTSTVATTNGDLSLTAVSNGTGNNNDGILANNTSTLSSVEGNILINANASTSGTGNQLIGLFTASNAVIQNTNGDITVNSTGGDGTGNFMVGTALITGSSIQTTGTGAVNISGIGGSGVASNYGVYTQNGATSIQANGGGINLNGTGGASTGSFSMGVFFNSDSDIIENGTGAITITGSGNTANSDSYGVYLQNNDTYVISNGGGITITGNGGVTATNVSRGVYLINGTIQDTGAGAVVMNGTNGTATDDSQGIVLANSLSVTSNTGEIQLNGVSTGTIGTLNQGVLFSDNATAVSTSGNITLNGTSAATDFAAIDFDETNSGAITQLQTTGQILLNGVTGDINTPPGITTASLWNGTDLIIDGVLAPGQSPGQVLITGAFAMSVGDTYEVEFDAFTTPGTDFDQIVVAGTVAVTDATLVLVNNTGAIEDECDTLLLIDNDGTDAIVGTFNGIAEGDSVALGGITGKVSYVGGDGNDFVLILDDTAPTITCQDITIQLDGNGAAVITALDVTGVSTDNCGVASSSIDIDTFDCSNVGPNNVTLTVTDVNGNSSTCVAIVTVEDTIPPMLTCPADILAFTNGGNCGATVTFAEPVATDNCGIDFIVQQAGIASGEIFPVGVTTNQFIVVDVNGNTATCSFTVTVEDNTDPMAVCQDITVMLDATGTAVIVAGDVDGGSTDNCLVDTLSIDIDTFTCADLGDNTVTLTVTDTSGNTDTCTAIVTVVNGVAPTAVCQDATVQLDAFGMVSITDASIFDGGSVDACGGTNLTFSVSPSSFTCDDLGENTVTLTVTDDGGNTSTCTAILTVEDLEAPTVSCMDLTVSLDENGEASINPADLVVMSADNCGVVSTTADITAFDCDDVGAGVTVTVTVADEAGNTASCTATVTVLDEIAPALVCPADLTVQTIEGTQYEVEDFVVSGVVTATDNCTDPVIVVSQDPAVGDLLDPGVYPVSITVADDSGNETSCTFDLTVESVLAIGDTNFDISSLTMFPNPASDFVVLSNPQQIPLEDVAIYDVTGRLVKTVDARQMSTELTIDIFELASATYLFIINVDGAQVTQQIIKQ